MRLYWDTSGLIRAHALKQTPVGVTRPHTVAEFFCILTGPGVAETVKGQTFKQVISPALAIYKRSKRPLLSRNYSVAG